MRSILLQRDDELRRESVLEDFVHGALERFGLPVPVVQHRIVVAGRNRRIDLCYPESMLALEPIGFDRRRFRQRFDEDALRGNELQLAGYRVLYFTSAFTDWKVATQVAEALALPTPARPRRPLTFLEWLARRDRLGTSSPRPATKYPNGSGTLG
jgi:hypothetical protein